MLISKYLNICILLVVYLLTRDTTGGEQLTVLNNGHVIDNKTHDFKSVSFLN